MELSFKSTCRRLGTALLTLLVVFACYETAGAAMNGRIRLEHKTLSDGSDRSADIAPSSKVEVIATGYTAGVESTGKRPGHPQYGITYSGVKVRRDYVSTIAADPSVFPIGTLLDIPGYGIGVVADTGSAIKGNKIDLYFNTIQQVYEQWGKRAVTVKVIRKGDGKLTEARLMEMNRAVKAEQLIPQSKSES